MTPINMLSSTVAEGTIFRRSSTQAIVEVKFKMVCLQSCSIRPDRLLRCFIILFRLLHPRLLLGCYSSLEQGSLGEKLGFDFFGEMVLFEGNRTTRIFVHFNTGSYSGQQGNDS